MNLSERQHEVYFDTSGLDLGEAEAILEILINDQRGINWWIGDLVRLARHQLGDNYTQVIPLNASPGLIQRCEAVALAYPQQSDRNPLATWTQHMQVAKKPDRKERIAAMVSQGQTSDESKQDAQRWLLAVDTNYYLHRFWFSGAGIESAFELSRWIARTAERLKVMGLTDVACCFDSKRNHRKQLTESWEDKYKDRPAKDEELLNQLQHVGELLFQNNFACVTVEGMEADDCMASLAKQFPGRVTLLTQDKDCRQCLSSKCNMLLDVEWEADETTGEMIPSYKWLDAKTHTETTGITPAQWPEFQSLMGDNVDGIRGAEGIGEKGAADLIQLFGTVDAAILAAKNDDERIRPKKREALIAFQSKLETTRKLVTLRDDLEIRVSTRI